MKVKEILGIVLLVIGCFLIQPIAAASMEEVQNFLANDTTDERIYNNQQMPYHTCGHFTQDLITNATKEGIRIYPVYLYARISCDHIIAAVEINRTWIFIEPQNDGMYSEQALKSAFRGYRIGTHVRCSPYLKLNRVNGLMEMRTF